MFATDRCVAGLGGDRIETVSLGKVAGAAALFLPMHARKVRLAVQALAKAQHGLSAENLQTRALELELRATADAGQILREAAAAYNAVGAFFARANVEMITQCAMAMPALEKTLKVKDGRVVAQWNETVFEERECVVERIRIHAGPGRKKGRGLGVSGRLRREIEEAERSGKIRRVVDRYPGVLSIVQERQKRPHRVTYARETPFPRDIVVPPIVPADLDSLLDR